MRGPVTSRARKLIASQSVGRQLAARSSVVIPSSRRSPEAKKRSAAPTLSESRYPHASASETMVRSAWNASALGRTLSTESPAAKP